MHWFIQALKRFGDFSGRSRRKEYWMYTLFLTIIAVVAMIMDHFSGWTLTIGESSSGGFYLLSAFLFIVPTIAVSVRRLHDTGRSGWMFLLSFIPIIGQIWLIVLYVIAGDKGRNEYGVDPKEIEEVEENPFRLK